MEEDPIVLPERWEVWAGFSMTLTVLCVVVFALWMGKESSASVERVACAGISNSLECEFETFFGVSPEHDEAPNRVMSRLAGIYNSACGENSQADFGEAIEEMARAERLAESFGLLVQLKYKFFRWIGKCPPAENALGDHRKVVAL